MPAMEIFATPHAHVKKFPAVVVIKPHGHLMGGDETTELESLIERFDTDEVRCLVINLSDVGMMNSLAISRLIRGHIRFSKRGARVHLCHLDTRIQNVFVIAKLSMVFNIFGTEEQAIAGCAGGD